jgi:hypothetical protein
MKEDANIPVGWRVGGLADWSGKVLWDKGLSVRQGVFNLAEWRSGPGPLAGWRSGQEKCCGASG